MVTMVKQGPRKQKETFVRCQEIFKGLPINSDESKKRGVAKTCFK